MQGSISGGLYCIANLNTVLHCMNDMGAAMLHTLSPFSVAMHTNYFDRREFTFCNEPTTITNLKFEVCKSVHHLVIQINHQLDATISSVFYLTFIYSSTCFGRPHGHHQELSNCSSSLWFYLRSVVIAVLLVVLRPAGPTTTNSTATTKLRR
jgi:hypothetical protein